MTGREGGGSGGSSAAQLTAGLVGAPFGLKGFVKIRSLSGETGHLLRLRSVLIRQGTAERTLVIEESAPVHAGVLMKFAGIDSPEEAKTLRGAELLVDRSQAAPLGRDEYYVEDLRGVAVTAGSGGEILGHITGIVEGGGGNLAEIRLPGGALRLVPFRNEFFAGIDLESRRVELLKQWILE